MQVDIESARPAGASISTLDPFSADAIVNAVATNQAIREAGELVWLETCGMWATGRYAAANRILGDFENFSSAKRPFTHPDFPLPAILVTDDPPDHGPIRSVMNRILSPKLLRANEATYRSAAISTIDGLLCDKVVDGSSDLALPFVLSAFGDTVGLRDDGRENLVTFGAAILNTFGPVNELFLTLVERASDATRWVEAQCAREALKPHGLGAAIYEAKARGEVSDEQAGLLLMSLLSAGVDTTAGAITNMLHCFARYPDQYARLRREPGLRTRAFEEVLRYLSPARVFGRVAHRDTELFGQTVRKGDGVLVFLGATGRDASIWPDAENFDVGRAAGKHISFGIGIHNCIGQMLTRAEALALLEILIEKVERIEAAGNPEALMSNTITSFEKLPLRFVAA
jgi:cytochrome P450